MNIYIYISKKYALMRPKNLASSLRILQVRFSRECRGGGDIRTHIIMDIATY